MFYLIRGVNGKKVGVIFSMLWIVIHKRDVSKLAPTFITNDMAFSPDVRSIFGQELLVNGTRRIARLPTGVCSCYR